MAIKTEIPNNNDEEYKKYNNNNTRSFVYSSCLPVFSEWMVGYIFMLLRGINAEAHPLFIYKIIKKI